MKPSVAGGGGVCVCVVVCCSQPARAINKMSEVSVLVNASGILKDQLSLAGLRSRKPLPKFDACIKFGA